MPQKVDHRRALAERNAAGILDAVERLLARGGTLNMAAVAAEAGVSRPTLYAHYGTINHLVEAVVERYVTRSTTAFAAARTEDGPADEALERLLEASWGRLADFHGLLRVATEHLTPAVVQRTHHTMMAPLDALIERGRGEGRFRTDVPAGWLQTMYFQLVHGAAEYAAREGVPRDEALAWLRATARSVYLA